MDEKVFEEKGFRVTSPYGSRSHPITGKVHTHSGIDLSKRHQAPIHAFIPGKVLYSGWGQRGTGLGGYGKVVFIKDNNGYGHLYAHLDKTSVGRGTEVDTHTVIGLQGATGNVTGSHLHYEVRTKTSPSYGWSHHTNPGEYVAAHQNPDFYVDGKPMDPPRIIKDGVTYAAMRMILEELGISVRWEDRVTYIGKMPKETYYDWHGQATEWNSLILAKADPMDTYIRMETATPFTAPDFDGINSAFFNTSNMEPLGVLYYDGKIICDGVERVPARSCLIVYKDGSCDIQPVHLFSEQFDENERKDIHLAVGGFSSRASEREREQVNPSVNPGGRAHRTYIGFRNDIIILGCTTNAMTLEQLESYMEQVFPDKDHWLNLDGGGSSGAYFDNGDRQAVYHRNARNVPALLGVVRR